MGTIQGIAARALREQCVAEMVGRMGNGLLMLDPCWGYNVRDSGEDEIGVPEEIHVAECTAKRQKRTKPMVPLYQPHHNEYWMQHEYYGHDFDDIPF